MNYSIHSSRTGEKLLTIELADDLVEYLSSDTAEGFFRAGQIDELIDAGLDSNEIVYALCA